jgi:hypothetical protein
VFFDVRNQTSYPHGTTDKITVLYTFVFNILYDKGIKKQKKHSGQNLRKDNSNFLPKMGWAAI